MFFECRLYSLYDTGSNIMIALFQFDFFNIGYHDTS